MQSIKNMLSKVLPDRQVNLVVAILIALIAAITLIAILNIAVWLVKGLFLLSEGGLAFYLTLLLVVIVSVIIGYYAWKKSSASSELRNEEMVEGTREYLLEIEKRSVGQQAHVISAEEQKRWKDRGSGKQASSKSKVLDAMKVADAAPTVETISRVERELDKMSLDPTSDDAWIASIRWELGQLRKKL